MANVGSGTGAVWVKNGVIELLGHYINAWICGLEHETDLPRRESVKIYKLILDYLAQHPCKYRAMWPLPPPSFYLILVRFAAHRGDCSTEFHHMAAIERHPMSRHLQHID
jgi:hypothetical protein